MIPEVAPGSVSGSYQVPRHAELTSPPVQGTACLFRTCCDVDVWPLQVDLACLQLTRSSLHLARLTSAAAVLTLEQSSPIALPIPALHLDRLRFFLDGETPLMHLLYELLFFRLQEVRASDGTEEPRRTAILPKSCLLPVGFSPEEDLFDHDPRSCPGFRLLTEYFSFPDKFMFFDVAGLRAKELEACGNKLQLRFMLSPFGATERHHRLIQSLSPANFKLGCVPAVNLFKAPGAPIQVNHRQVSYPVMADSRTLGAFEVFSIDTVTRVERTGSSRGAMTVPPFYAIRHGWEEKASPFYWYASREASRRRHDRGTDVELTLVDLDFQPLRPDAEILSLQLTCTNRDLPQALPFGGTGASQDTFKVTGHSAVKTARPLRKPTPSLSPPSKRGLQWSLISHLSLNHLALASDGPQALKEALQLCKVTDAAAVAQQIQGIAALAARPTTTRLPGRAFASLVRGVEVHVTFDETCFVGSNLYLFASVLERFFAYACPPNSFVKFRMSTLQQESEVAPWPPRSGATALI